MPGGLDSYGGGDVHQFDNVPFLALSLKDATLSLAVMAMVCSGAAALANAV